MATYDPVSTATALAENYVYARQMQLENNNAAAQTKLSALNTLKASLNTFTSALNTFSSKGGVVQQTTSVSGTGASASASSTASPGSYTFEVKSLAKAQQSLYKMTDLKLPEQEAPPAEGQKAQLPVQPRFIVSLGNGGFLAVDLSQADTDQDGKLSVSEVARAINAQSDKKISASTMTVDGEQQLVLTAGQSGKEGAFEVRLFDAGVSNEDIERHLAQPIATESSDSQEPAEGEGAGASTPVVPTTDSPELALPNEVDGQAEVVSEAPPAAITSRAINASRTLAEASDAVFWIGDPAQPVKEGGLGRIEVTQSSNTYRGIDGVSVTFKEVSDKPVTVTVAKDESSTKANMDSFVKAYNTLVQSIDRQTASGNAESGVSAGALANDSGVRSLRNQLNTLLRSTVDGESLTAYGISAKRDGTIELDEKRFAQKVAQNPEGIEKLLGQTASLEYQRTGVLGKLQTFVNGWTNSSGGLLQSRQDSIQKQQKQYTKEQATIERMYEQAYQRYLQQFSTLANLESQFGSTSDMLSAMFKTDSSD